jgi:hypothetical protein
MLHILILIINIIYLFLTKLNYTLKEFLTQLTYVALFGKTYVNGLKKLIGKVYVPFVIRSNVTVPERLLLKRIMLTVYYPFARLLSVCSFAHPFAHKR